MPPSNNHDSLQAPQTVRTRVADHLLVLHRILIANPECLEGMLSAKAL